MGEFEQEIRQRIDDKTKPLGALGRLEEVAASIARIMGSLEPRLQRCALTIFAADHGIAQEGVSAYPQAVTRQMVANFLSGGAAANVFARVSGVELRVVDSGIAGEPMLHQALLSRRIAPGTANCVHGPAMTLAQAERALAWGRSLGGDGDWDAAIFGEMGIGNSSSAALLAHVLTGVSLDSVIGTGTGLDAAGLARKRAVLQRAAARVGGGLSVERALTEFGGFEIAMMAGAFIGAAEARRPALVDGFIATAAALVAVRLHPPARHAMIFAHKSPEPGHAVLLDVLEARPLFDLGLRLGEGTGALLAWPLLKSAAAMLRDMASFKTAGVSGPAEPS